MLREQARGHRPGGLFTLGHFFAKDQSSNLGQPGLQPLGFTGEKKTQKDSGGLEGSVQFSSSVVSNSASPWTAARQASLSITNSRSLPKLMSIASVIPSNHLILCHPLLLLSSIFPSVFSNESLLCIRWSNYWSFTFNISPSSEHPGLISFRMNSLDLLAVLGTLKSLLQHHSSKASILQRSAFFTVQLTSIHDHWTNHSLD